MNQIEYQCLHCGDVPKAISAGFNVNEMPQSSVTGMVKYHWTCNNCYKENYYTKQEDPRDIKNMMDLFEKYYPNMFKPDEIVKENE